MQLWTSSFPAHPCAHAHTEMSNPDSVSSIACPSLWASQNSAAGYFLVEHQEKPCEVKHSRTTAVARESWSSKNSVDSLLSLPLVFVHVSKNFPRPLSNAEPRSWHWCTRSMLGGGEFRHQDNFTTSPWVLQKHSLSYVAVNSQTVCTIRVC